MLLCSVWKYFSEPSACRSHTDLIVYVCIALCYVKFDTTPYAENLQQIQHIFDVVVR